METGETQTWLNWPFLKELLFNKEKENEKVRRLQVLYVK